MPWEIIYYEAFRSELMAKHREKMLKETSRAWQELRKRLGINHREKRTLIDPSQDVLF